MRAAESDPQTECPVCAGGAFTVHCDSPLCSWLRCVACDVTWCYETGSFARLASNGGRRRKGDG